MPENFKTGYVADPISYSAMGAQLGKSLGENLENIGSRLLEKRRANDAAYGFSKSFGEVVPSAVEPRYREGLQMSLDILQESAVRAKQSGSVEDTRAYVDARQNFTDMKNLASAKAAQNYSTLGKVRLNELDGMVNTPEQEAASYALYAAPPQWERSGNNVMVVGSSIDGAVGAQVGWRDTMLGDINDIYVPQMRAPESEFEASAVATGIVATLDRQVDIFQEKDEYGFSTGELLSEEAYGSISTSIYNKIESGGAPALNMISLTAYGSIDRAGQELNSNDPGRAVTIYNPEINSVAFASGTPVTEGALDADGKYVFTEESVPAAGVGGYNKKQVESWRTAYKNYYETVAPTSFQNIKRLDESVASKKYQESLIPDVSEGLAPPTLLHSELNFSPTEDVAKMVPAFSAKASLSGRTFDFVSDEGYKTRINDVHFDRTQGEPIGFEVLRARDRLDKVINFDDASTYDVVTVRNGEEGFNEILSSLTDIAPSAKTKHGGASFLQSAKDEILRMNQPVDSGSWLAGADAGDTEPKQERAGGWGSTKGTSTAADSAYADLTGQYFALLFSKYGQAIVDEVTAAQVSDYVDGLEDEEKEKAMRNIVIFAGKNQKPLISGGRLAFEKK